MYKTEPIKRTRVRYGTRTYLPTGKVYVTDDEKTEILLHSKVQNGDDNPDWRNDISRGVDAGNYYSCTGGSFNTARFHGEARTATEKYLFHGSVMPPLPGIFDTSYHQPTADIALAKWKSRIRAHVGDHMLGEPLGEAKHLGKTFTQGANFLADTLKTLASQGLGRLLGSKQGQKFLARSYLNYQFGISPVISDINKSILALDDFFKREDHVARESGSHKRKGVVGNSYAEVVTVGSLQPFIGHDSGDWQQSYKYIGAMKVKFKSSNSYNVVEHLGLGPRDVIPALWNLTRLSWAVDYFVNVGEYLEDTFYAFPGDLIFLVRNTKFTGRASRIYSEKPSLSSIVYTNRVIGSPSMRYYSFQREPLSAVPDIGLRIRHVDEVGKHALKKVTNLAAVLRTTL